MLNWVSLLLTLGFLLMVFGIRFMMVRNSLKLGKPSEPRLVLLKKEWSRLLPLGFIIFMIGFLGHYLGIANVDVAKNIANAGGMIFGLGIPQYIYWKYGMENDESIKKSNSNLRKLAWGVTVAGFIVLIVAGIFSVK